MQTVILLGKGELGIRVANWFRNSADFKLSAVVPAIPEPSWAPSLRAWAVERHVDVIESGHFQDLPGVRDDNWSVDLAVSIFYDRIIKEWFIRKCRRILNLHNGPLPKYRGVSPINWALKNEELEHGLTIHEITPGIDDGAIIGQLKYSIYPQFDEVRDVYNRSIEYGWVLFQQTMPLIGKIKPREQDHALATYYNKQQNSLLGERKHFTREQSLVLEEAGEQSHTR
jgi:methionyl-tRNA formyltransferase